MFYSDEELNQIFNNNKKLIDRAYLYTKMKYGVENADLAIYEFFKDYSVGRITRDNNCRSNLEALTYHYYETLQILMEYAMASYISNNINKTFSLDEIYSYANDAKNPNLKYDRETIVSLVAIAGGWSPYWLTNLLACNKRVREVLIKSMIEERYNENQKQKLDTSRRGKLVTLSNGKKIFVNIDTLNHNIDNMIRDDEDTYLKDDLATAEDSHKKRG